MTIAPRRRLGVLLALLCLTLAVASCDAGDDEGPNSDGAEGTGATEPTEASEPDGSDAFAASVGLSGGEEVPGPGDPDGTGTAHIEVASGAEELCYTLTVEDVDDVTAAHIHEAGTGSAGPVAVTLDPPVDGTSEGCVSTTRAILDGLRSGDRAFYVNIHTKAFPDGAIRGQITEA